MKFTHGIRFRLLLLGIVPASLMTLTMVGYEISTRINHLEFTLHERGRTISRQLATAAVYGVFSGNHSILQNLCESTLLEPDVTEVAILDSGGNLLVVSSSDSYASIGDEMTFSAQVFNPIQINPNEAFDSMFYNTTDSAAPTLLGTVQVKLSRAGTRLYARKLLYNNLALTGLGLLFIGLLANRMARRVSEPILALTRAVHAISEGNFNARAEFPAEGEMQRLKDGFNGMAEELGRYHDDLQGQIDTATAKLQETLNSLEEKNRHLEQARKFAEAQNEIKSQFLAHMSHEIRTPMNGVIGFTDLLAKTRLTIEQKEQVQLIDRSAKNLLTIINEILDLSKLESGKFSLNIREFQLRPHIEDAIALLTPQAKTLEIIQYIDKNVPDTIQGDPLRIQQVITNLLGNAIKFTRHGRIVIRVRPYCAGGRPMILFSVSDTGCGISEEDRTNLFSPFLQLSAFAIDQERGTGLGLAISKNIVERMKGTINVASRPGVGSTFWFTLPIDNVPREDHWMVRFRGALIDPEAISRKALESQLAYLGGDISSYSHIEELLHASPDRVGRYDFIFIANVDDDALDCDLSRQQLAALRARFYAALVLLQQPYQRNPAWIAPLGIGARMTIPCGSDILRKTLQRISQQTANTPAKQGLPKRLPDAGKKAFSFLIADDNEINRLLLKAQLSRNDSRIHEARDGKEALDLILTCRFEMIFLDLQMPFANGMEIVRTLKSRDNPNRQTPVIAITAHALSEQKQAILEAGFDECLIKPVLRDQLDEVISRRLAPDTHSAMPEPPPSSKASGYIDTMLERTEGNRELAQTLFDTLFAELPEQLAIIDEALARTDFETARHVTHKLHGSVGFCGFGGIKQAAHDLEAALHQGKHGELASHVERLRQEAEQLLSRKERIMAAF